MMKYCLILILFINVACFGQGYQASIADFRKGYIADFLTDPSSPLKKDDLQNLRFYDADSTYRVTATAEFQLDKPSFMMPSFTGGGQEYVPYAVVKFMLKGKPMELTIYRSIALSKMPKYADYLFLPFTDDTNGQKTYGGGRYIDMSTKDFNGNSVVIDFNKTYNPYCAYSNGYVCPKPPGENRLAIAIEAGEKLFDGASKH